MTSGNRGALNTELSAASQTEMLLMLAKPRQRGLDRALAATHSITSLSQVLISPLRLINMTKQ